MSEQEPYERDQFLEKEGIVGARWWNKHLQRDEVITRRSSLRGLLIGGAVVFGIGVLAIKNCDDDEDGASGVPERRNALEMQRNHGWNFGYRGEGVSVDGIDPQPFSAAQLSTLVADLAPKDARYSPYHVPTVLQSATAGPLTPLASDPLTAVKLPEIIRPMITVDMEVAYRRGLALAGLFSEAKVENVAVVVDLSGPESVAFAAGAAGTMAMVFTVDNWPHPRGVVPAHRTLAAAIHYQRRFSQTKPGPNAPPLFVLDRHRIDPYGDDATQFDNRHVAKLPVAAALTQMGIRHVLYVVPEGAVIQELDDLTDAFVGYQAAEIDVRVLPVSAFAPLWENYLYGGTAETHLCFWHDYPWVVPPPPCALAFAEPPGARYVPRPRVSPYSSGPGGSLKRPDQFATVAVFADDQHAVLGAHNGSTPAVPVRSGSWNRSTGSGCGG